jgi:hypothetical protein
MKKSAVGTFSGIRTPAIKPTMETQKEQEEKCHVRIRFIALYYSPGGRELFI